VLVASSVLLIAFAVLATIDGIYIHLVRLRLHRRPQSWREHAWHTSRAVLFVPLLASVFSGAWLAVGIAALVVDQLVEVLDVVSERESRADLGGVGRGELAIHVAAIVVRAAAIVTAFYAPPVEVARLLLPGTVAVAALHVACAWVYRPATLACCMGRAG
jgi:hypothetical protein